MGENNAAVHRRARVGRHIFDRANQIYDEKFGVDVGADEHGQIRRVIPASFDVRILKEKNNESKEFD